MKFSPKVVRAAYEPAHQSRLESDLGRELNQSRRRIESEESAVRTRRRGRHAADLPERGIAQTRVREKEVRMVEDIKGSGANSELHSLTNGEILEQAHIGVEEMRPVVLVAPLSREIVVLGEGSRAAIDKRGGIQTTWDSWISSGSRVLNAT